MKAQILAAQTQVVVDDLYRPYRPKRRTRATIAKEKGLEGLANIILLQMTEQPLETEAESYLSEEKEVKTVAEKLTLASMCAGGVQERIDRALAKISDNILDLNTDAKKKRVLDVKITLTPNEDDREDVSVEVQTSVKLAPEMGLKTQLFINKDFRSGVTTLTEHAKGAIKGQLTLDECGMCMDPEKDSTPTAEELGCDPETGEVLEEKSEPPKESTKVISMRDAVNS